MKARLKTLGLAWGLAFAATLVSAFLITHRFSDTFFLTGASWFFPHGLATELFGFETSDTTWAAFPAACLAYVAVMAAALFTKRPLVFRILLALLCLMLILNIAGCHEDLVWLSES